MQVESEQTFSSSEPGQNAVLKTQL